MKNVILPALLISATASTAIAQPSLELINHTNKPMGYIVQRDDYHSLLGNANGDINPQAEVRLDVKYIDQVCKESSGYSSPTAYISTGWKKAGMTQAYDFMGVGRGCSAAHQNTDDVFVSGYISSHGLAFSMYNAHHAKVIFCSSADYKKNGFRCI